MIERIDTVVRRWLEAGPGNFTAATTDKLWEKVRAAFARHAGSEVARDVTVDDLADCLDRLGYRPVQRGDPERGFVWAISLPSVAQTAEPAA